MRPLFRTYAVTALAMLAIDAVWLTLMTEPFYRARLGHLLRDDLLFGPAAAFYLLYLLGVLLLAQRPACCWKGAAGAARCSACAPTAPTT